MGTVSFTKPTVRKHREHIKIWGVFTEENHPPPIRSRKTPQNKRVGGMSKRQKEYIREEWNKSMLFRQLRVTLLPNNNP
jgi:hypothetical protein